MDPSVESDEQLLLRARRDPDAFGVLYDRHVRELLAFFGDRTADGHLAADLAAETFAQAFVSRRRFVPKGDGAARAWLYGIARNQLGRYARRRRVSERARRKLAMEPLEVSDDAAARIEELSDLDGLRTQLLDALRSLSKAEFEAVRLRVIDELPYRQVATRLGCSEGAARVRVTRGLSRIAKEIG